LPVNENLSSVVLPGWTYSMVLSCLLPSTRKHRDSSVSQAATCYYQSTLSG